MMWLPLLASLLLHVALADPGKDAQPKRLYNFGLGKRAAYTYVSEYKRLPIYNFGLGKRMDETSLGSSSGGKQEDMDQTEDEYDEDSLKDADLKRMKQYSFGLGKRVPVKQYSFGLGKRFSGYEEPQDPLMDLVEEEKRSNGPSQGHRFSFGLGKREGSGKQDLRRGMQYSFGLGKRDGGGKQDLRRSMQYNFGLGKRSQPIDQL